jgi:hypothetical protein
VLWGAAAMDISIAGAERNVIMSDLSLMRRNHQRFPVMNPHSKNVQQTLHVQTDTVFMVNAGLCDGLGIGDGRIRHCVPRTGLRSLHGHLLPHHSAFPAMTLRIPSVGNSLATVAQSVASSSVVGIVLCRLATTHPPASITAFRSSVMTATRYPVTGVPIAVSLKPQAASEDLLLLQ